MLLERDIQSSGTLKDVIEFVKALERVKRAKQRLCGLYITQ